MKLFRYTSGHDDKYGPAADAEEAYERRIEVDPTFHFLPVAIEEVTIEGHEITVTPINEEANATGRRGRKTAQ